MRVVAVVQARMASRRLPGKVMEMVEGIPMVGRVLERARAVPCVDHVVLATSDGHSDDPVAAWALSNGWAVFRGSEQDVLERFRGAAEAAGADAVVRITADCPLLDPEVSGQVVARFLQGDADYASNIQPPTFPDGLDTEVLSMAALERASIEARLPSEREHVTLFIRENPGRFRAVNVSGTHDLSGLRWTVDEPEDLEFVRRVYRAAGTATLGMNQVLNIVAENPAIGALNGSFARNQGLIDSIRRDEEAGLR